jgi:cobalt-zinc-cadmium efflux system outer membrane protein
MKPLITVLAAAALFAGVVANAQSISDELKQRTGLGLPEEQSERVAGFTLPPGVVLTEQLSARDAVSIALWNNSALQADLAGLDVSRADLVEAGQFRNPRFSMLLPVGPKPFEFLLTWPIEEWWQRRHRIEAAKLSLDTVATGLIHNGLNLVRNVRVAHTDLWSAQERARTLEQSAELRDRMRALTEKRKANGDATGLDVNLSRADARLAAELALGARDEIAIFRSRLIHHLGMRRATRTFSAVLEARTRPLPDLISLLEIAMANRPDLCAAELSVT